MRYTPFSYTDRYGMRLQRLTLADGYLAYFQAFSNTYAPLSVLKERYVTALAHPLVKGIVVGTRPDCVDAEKLDYLSSLRDSGAIVEIEYGIESVFDQTGWLCESSLSC